MISLSENLYNSAIAGQRRKQHKPVSMAPGRIERAFEKGDGKEEKEGKQRTEVGSRKERGERKGTDRKRTEEEERTNPQLMLSLN